MEFEKDWNALTNSPVLSNTDTGLLGTVYRVGVAGSVDFGAGAISFNIDDWVYNDGSVWRKLTGSGLKTKSGKVVKATFTGNPKIATVTFTTAFDDANYSPVISQQTISNTSYSIAIETILAGSFIINLGANNINDLVDIRWVATKHGET